MRKRMDTKEPNKLRGGLRILSPDMPWLYVLSALVMTLLVEGLARRTPIGGFRFLARNPIGFWVNVGIILLTMLLAMLCPKRIPVLSLVGFTWFVLGMTECILLSSRVTPLTAVDFTVFFSVITIMHNYLTIPQIILIVAGLALCIGGLVFLFIRARRRRVYWRRALMTIGGSALVLMLLLVSGFAGGRISADFSNLSDAYNDYGFGYCFLLSIVDRGVDKPDDYSREAVQDILDTIPAGTDSGTAGNTKPNVIFVQLESFFDVNTLAGVTYSEEPLPNLKRLAAMYPSGQFEVPVIGAGTVNSEFEVLTGMRVKDFGAAEYPYKSILSEKTCETIAYDLLASGYRTHAIHNHQGSFYARNEVYTQLGFQDYTSIEYFRRPEYNKREWAKDSILTDEILSLITATEERDFVFAVSVQAHGKYPTDYVPVDGDIYVTGGVDDPLSLSKLNYYVSQLHEVDAFAGALYRAVMDLDEETVLVFYGDHLPSLAKDAALTLTTPDYETPYLIIANYELDMTAASNGQSLYAYQLFPLVMELIGNREGIINRFHTARKDTDGYLADLETLEYDILYGKRYALGGGSYPVMADMTMGTRPVRITEVTSDENFIRVTGENFTRYSVVTVGGSEKKTQYVDEHTLIVEKDLLSRLGLSRTITVRQVTTNGKTLSESPPFLFAPTGSETATKGGSASAP